MGTFISRNTSSSGGARVLATEAGISFDPPDRAVGGTVAWGTISDITAHRLMTNGRQVAALDVVVPVAGGERIHTVSSDMQGWEEFLGYLEAHLPSYLEVRRSDWRDCLNRLEPGGKLFLIALHVTSKLQIYANDPARWWNDPAEARRPTR